MPKFQILDLFAGIGGFSLAAHQLGWQTLAFVEKDEYCHKILRKNFNPNIPIYSDVRTFDGTKYRGIADIVCGGFPCQDISTAGTGIGIEGERSGLWSELFRTIRDVRPQYVVVENVAKLLVRGFGTVLRDLASVGYDVEWRVFSGCELGFPHSRERVFLVAYPNGKPRTFGILNRYCEKASTRNKVSGQWGEDWLKPEMATSPDSLLSAWSEQFSAPPLVRVDDGVPEIVDRLRVTGNAIIPQIASGIFRAINAAEKA